MMDKNPFDLCGMPFIREGDTVYIINNMPDPLSRKSMLDRMERFTLRYDDYRCPFDFMTEFDQWFQWKKREYADHEPTGQIMCDMVSDVDRIKAHKIEKRFQFRVSEDWGCFVPPRGGILFSGVSS